MDIHVYHMEKIYLPFRQFCAEHSVLMAVTQRAAPWFDQQIDGALGLSQ